MSAPHVNYTFQAQVVAVTDGDTVKLRADLGFDISVLVALRLNNVYAAERGQPNGSLHTDNLRALLPIGLKVTVVSTKLRGVARDKYGRYVADIYDGEEHINQLQQAFIGVRQGLGLGSAPRTLPDPQNAL